MLAAALLHAGMQIMSTMMDIVPMAIGVVSTASVCVMTTVLAVISCRREVKPSEIGSGDDWHSVYSEQKATGGGGDWNSLYSEQKATGGGGDWHSLYSEQEERKTAAVI
jgi:hypothetical protein